ncbi:hypothetical protein [Natronorubrum halophilum]|uniref:hypothetical protein n=1 Tax=Natronorubrum halophilum TaxID=1702106 RepID=UPI000EF65880|nr:hypothetical protein [Natronorubrum halophilum]
MKRRALLAVVPGITLVGCATRLGLVERVTITQKSVRLHPRGGGEPVYAAVRRYDPTGDEEGPYYHGEIHEALAGDIEEGAPITISESLVNRLRAQFETVEFRFRGCDTDGEDCRYTALVRADFNQIETGDIVDVIYRSSGAGLVAVHDPYGSRD